MHKLLMEIPTRIATERLYLRCYQPGDGDWYFAMSQKNRQHLSRYESGNIVMTIKSEEEAEIAVRDLEAHRVRLVTDDTNVRSQRVAERCGMLREGHFRENKKNPDGTLSGILFYCMLRSEFEALKRN